MNKVFFSIVIPTFNRAHFIVKTIQSVLVQDFVDFEILVIDDGSTDHTQAVVSAIQDDRLTYIFKKNEERAVARNVGAQLSKGQYVNFLDSDDLLYPNHLTVAYDFINTHNNPEAFHLGFDVKTETGQTIKKVDNIRDIKKELLNGNTLSCNGVFLSRDTIIQNPFNQERLLSSLEDWELWLRLACRMPFFSVNKITSTVVLHNERSVVSVNQMSIKEKTACFIKLIQLDDFNRKVFGPDLKKVISSALMYASLHLAMAGSTKFQVIQFAYKGVRHNFNALFTRRFLVIMKLLILR